VLYLPSLVSGIPLVLKVYSSSSPFCLLHSFALVIASYTTLLIQRIELVYSTRSLTLRATPLFRIVEETTNSNYLTALIGVDLTDPLLHHAQAGG